MEAQLRLADGDTGGAIGLWNQLALQLLAREFPWERTEAAGIVERLEELPEALEVVAPLRARLTKAEERLEPPRPPTTSTPIRLLVVGGDEGQARYEAEIRQVLATDAPYIAVEFITTGWSSNWSSKAEEVVRRLDHADGLVMHYFIRTMFGRTVRKAAGSKPWRSVGGHGRDGILRGIYACAAAVAPDR